MTAGRIDFNQHMEVGVSRKGVRGFDLQFYSAILWLPEVLQNKIRNTRSLAKLSLCSKIFAGLDSETTLN